MSLQRVQELLECVVGHRAGELTVDIVCWTDRQRLAGAFFLAVALEGAERRHQKRARQKEGVRPNKTP